MPLIKTPDQRVRVFISSTINELEDERKAAREAIENIRLIPVFFEAGARPHPPRDLYSAYLDQSHIFLGIYWNSYGWVAPGQSISGLEDEYRLCGNNKPKLIYVKKSNERQPLLEKLINEIGNSDTACYQKFSNAEELTKLIENDLSVLMSEIFENALSSKHANENIDIETKEITRIEDIPLLKSDLIGREDDIQKITTLITKKEVSLVTLLGAGGTGKTTLAIHLAHLLKDGFTNGVVFISLAPVTDFKLVPSSIANTLGLQDSGKAPIEQALVEYLIDKNLLLILDNFEQIVEASRLISDIINHCKHVKIIVTTRTSLHLRNERIYNLSTLELPGENQTIIAEELKNYAATKLFVDRALEVNPRIILDQENTNSILEICRRMDGLPLAIELAAARTRFFQPAALMNRIEKALDFGSKGQRDLPERQQTLRAAIEWSYNLLTSDTQKAFRKLGIFRRSWTLEAADVIMLEKDLSLDIEELTERLLDVSLIKPVLVNHTSEPRFNMLQTVHEFANEILENSSEYKETKLKYATYFYDLLISAYEHLWGRNAEPWLDKLEYEYQNIRAAFKFFNEEKNYEKSWQFIYLLSPYWTVRGGFSECKDWIEACGMHDNTINKSDAISPMIKGRSLTWAGFCQLFLFDFEHGFGDLNQAEYLLDAIQDQEGLMVAYIFDGCYGSYLQNPDAEEKILKGKSICENLGNELLLAMFYLWSTEYYRQKGDFHVIIENIQKARDIAIKNGFIYFHAASYIIEFSFSLLDSKNDWEITLQHSIEMYCILPPHGYKGLKAAAKSAEAYSLLMSGRANEAEIPLILTLELGRVSGEMESNVYNTIVAVHFYWLKGNKEKSYKLLGAFDQFVQTTDYPLVGGAEVQYQKLSALLDAEKNLPDHKIWYESGKRMSLNEGVVYALKR